MTIPAGWIRHTITELGLSFAINPDWPFGTFSLPDCIIVHQQLPGQAGMFFARYGAGQRIEEFVAGLGDALTTVAVMADEPAALAGLPARRMVVRINRKGGGSYDDDAPVRERSPMVQARLVVLGLELRRTPVLVGYQVYEDETTTYQPTLDQMLASVTITE